MVGKLKYCAGAALLLLLTAATTVFAQESPFTVLSNNADTANRKLYVEIMYERPSCDDYQVAFRMVSDAADLDTLVAVDSILNNPGTYELSADKKTLARPQAGGYKLRFSLPEGVEYGDSAYICLEASKLAYLCRDCGTGGADIILEPANVDPFCPYDNTNGDMVACRRRVSREGNWEGWIRDSRDCQPYRVVLMPDGKWWLAQNLNYTKDLNNTGNSNGSTVQNNTLYGNYWCPGGAATPTVPKQPLGNNGSVTTYGEDGCKTYGALYTWNTAIRLNGRGAETLASTTRVAPSTAQGICPNGWLLPSDFDWGVMLNTIEGCAAPTVVSGAAPGAQATTAPCNHIPNANGNFYYLGSFQMFADIKAVNSCPPHTYAADSSCATATNPAWMWYRSDYTGKVASSLYLGNDRYGFSLLPAGYREANGANFYYLGSRSRHWTSTHDNGNSGFTREFITKWDGKNPAAGAYLYAKWYGESVRCIKPKSDIFRVISNIHSGYEDLTPAAGSQVTLALQRAIDDYTYSWNGGAYQSSSSTTITMPSTPGATVEVSLSVKNKAGSVVVNNIRKTLTACPYMGTDRLASSCAKRTEGAQNWVIKLNPADNYLLYPVTAAQMSNGSWYTDPLDIPTKRSYYCNTSAAQYATAAASRATYCPEGWRLLASTMEFSDMFLSDISKTWQTMLPHYGLTWYNDFYALSSCSQGSHMNLWIAGQTGLGDSYVSTTGVALATNIASGWSANGNTNLRCVRTEGEDGLGVELYASGINGASAMLTAPSAATWYDAPTGGNVIGTGTTFASTVPRKVYAEVSVAGGTRRISGVIAQRYDYNGSYYTVNLPEGTYRMQAYGAYGGSNSYGALGGRGGYAAGTITLDADATFYVYVGQQPGNQATVGGYNGGGATTSGANGVAGGGASDIRLVSGAWNTPAGLRSRILVAGGGGGNGGWPGNSAAAIGGAGGGLTAANGVNYCSGCSVYPNIATGGTQTAGGASGTNNYSGHTTGVNGTFGVGGAGSSPTYGGGGGGGWYGGGGGGIQSSVVGSGAGGSSYISGHQGCVAITSADDQTPKSGCTNGTTDVECSKHHSGYVFTNTLMHSGIQASNGMVLIVPR